VTLIEIRFEMCVSSTKMEPGNSRATSWQNLNSQIPDRGTSGVSQEALGLISILHFRPAAI
jgi:hypothetical protein